MLASMALIRILHGPNLNLLGLREPDIYGTSDLASIDRGLRADAEASGHQVHSFQSNAEHELLRQVQSASDDGVACLIVNPAAFTHTSVALRDALLAIGLPFIEVHLSNTAARERFRQHSLFSDIAAGTITGFGALSYQLALRAAVHIVNR